MTELTSTGATMTDRDELARDLSAADADTWEKMAENLLAAGYRKPRTIATVEELDALPSGSTILDQNVTAIKADSVWWFQVGPFEPNLPVAVLYTPEEPQ